VTVSAAKTAVADEPPPQPLNMRAVHAVNSASLLRNKCFKPYCMMLVLACEADFPA